jgi:DHA2 family multidrug resistance protein
LWSGILQGFGVGIVYVPMASMTFATLPVDQRNEGTAMFSLTRNVGSSVGISIVQSLLTSNTQILHSALAQHVSPFNIANRNPQLASQLAIPNGLAGLNAELTGQASMVAYIDDFKLMLILTLCALPLLLLIRAPSRQRTQTEELPNVLLD